MDTIQAYPFAFYKRKFEQKLGVKTTSRPLECFQFGKAASGCDYSVLQMK